MTSPPRGVAASTPAALARGLRIVAGLAGGSPVALVPEQPLVATVRHDMVDHGRRHHAPLGLAGGTQWVLREERRPCAAPARTVASACRARPLLVQLPFHCRRAAPARRAMHRRPGRHGGPVSSAAISFDRTGERDQSGAHGGRRSQGKRCAERVRELDRAWGRPSQPVAWPSQPNSPPGGPGGLSGTHSSSLPRSFIL
jgi:hypothetical protein